MVPSAAQVIPGAAVNIVLKADQRTGRQVSGAVQDVLTRGDHPRGIKVRLTDGRVGRVQSIAPQSQSSATATSAAHAGNVDEQTGGRGTERPAGGRRDGPSRFRDIRLDEELDRPPETIGLDAYIKPAGKKGRQRRKGGAAGGAAAVATEDQDGENEAGPGERSGPAGPELVVCPVCNNFQGDEAAVGHHVAAHFD